MSKGKHTCSICGEDFHDSCTNLVCIVGWHGHVSTGGSHDDLGPDPLEERLNRSYTVGFAAGLESAAKIALDMAAKAFAGNRDEEARLLRSTSARFAEMARTRMEVQP